MEVQKDFRELLELFGNRKIIDVEANCLSTRQFVRDKRALGRKKDLADLEALGDA